MNPIYPPTGALLAGGDSNFIGSVDGFDIWFALIQDSGKDILAYVAYDGTGCNNSSELMHTGKWVGGIAGNPKFPLSEGPAAKDLPDEVKVFMLNHFRMAQ